MIKMSREPITVKTHPNHPLVGQFYDGWDGRIYYCDRYDPACGFWLVSLDDGFRKCISEQTISRTYHPISLSEDNSFGVSALRMFPRPQVLNFREKKKVLDAL